jgi:hypothetical protein
MTVMRPLLVILLVMLILLLALPIAMAMDMEGGSCPACNATERPFAAGMCLAILALGVFSVCFARGRLVLAPARAGDSPTLSGLFRPPRAV